MPTFTVSSTEGQARTGRLRHRRGELETPALLLYSRRGSPLYLTPDMLVHLGPEGQNLLLDATQFLGNPKPSTVAKSPGGGRGFCALDAKLLAVTGRDSVVYNYRQWKKGTNAGVRVEAFSGGQALEPGLYNTVAALFDPDLLVSLSDEVPAEAQEERLRSSVRRSLGWLDAALAAFESSGTAILAPIQGGTSVELRRMSAAGSAARTGVFGFALAGFATGETAEQRRGCMGAALGELPPAAFKFLQGPLPPAAVLEAVAAGVDCFEATFATQMTAAGYALDLEEEAAAAKGGEPGSACRDSKFNVLDPRLREDAGPLVDGCGCYTCRRHTRAYLHHLLLAHEMTAQVLLELHNVHQMLRFCGGMRAAIAEGRFEGFRARFLERRRRLRDGRDSA